MSQEQRLFSHRPRKGQRALAVLLCFQFILACGGASADPTPPVAGTGSGPRALAHDGPAFDFDGRDLEHSFSLTDQETHVVYEDRYVPKTCTRQEQVGSHQDCHTEWDNVCRTEYRQECTPITRRECTPISRRVCDTEWRQVCETTYRQECRTEQICRDVPDQVCRVDSSGRQICTPITRRVCQPQQICRQVPQQVCRQVPQQVCRDVWDQVCRDVPDQVCRQVPYQNCQNVPRQVCQTIPDYRDVQYECGSTQHVPVGTELDFDVRADVSVIFASLSEGAQANEKFGLSIDGSNVSLRLIQGSGQYLVQADRKVSVEITAPKVKQIKVEFKVTLLPLAEATTHLKAGIQGVALDSTRIEFRVGRVAHAELLSLKLNLSRLTSGSEAPVFAGIVPSDAVLLNPSEDGTAVAVDLSRLRLSSPMQSGQYRVTLGVGIPRPLGAGFLNPEILGNQADLSSTTLAIVRN